jgi:hypothetical protein
MSPVAAEFASACSAEGAPLVVVGVDVTGGPFVVGVVTVGALLLLEPQPATNSAVVHTKATMRTVIGCDGRRGCLNDA